MLFQDSAHSAMSLKLISQVKLNKVKSLNEFKLIHLAVHIRISLDRCFLEAALSALIH